MTTDYDTFAEAYSRQNEASLLNAHYERPAMIRLAGDVDGRRVLDAGCGSGPLSAALRDYALPGGLVGAAGGAASGAAVGRTTRPVEIRQVGEPPYATDTPRELLPAGIGDRKAFVCFLFFVLEAPGAG